MKNSPLKPISSKMHNFFSLVNDILAHPEVQKMENFIQHGTTTCLSHSLYVAYTAYCLATSLKVNTREVARGAMLHDFYLYDWHIKGDRKGLHGFTHPKDALKNATHYFELSDIKMQIIERHMWPLTLKPPTKKASLIVTLCDKYCTVLETLGLEDKALIDDLLMHAHGLNS